MRGYEQANWLALVVPVVGTIMMDRGGFAKTLYEHILADDTRTHEAARSRMI